MIRSVLGSRASIGGVLGSGRGGAAAAWYLAGGAIAAGDVAEWVESPTIGQLYAGGTLTGAWTIAVRTAQNPTGNSYVFDSLNGRIILGISGGNNGFFVGAWYGPLFDLSGTVATYFLVSDGANVQAYKDNSAVGSAVSSSVDIGGTTRWRNDQANSFWPWEVDVPRAAVYKIALDSTQRAALYSSMAA